MSSVTSHTPTQPLKLPPAPLHVVTLGHRRQDRLEFGERVSSGGEPSAEAPTRRANGTSARVAVAPISDGYLPGPARLATVRPGVDWPTMLVDRFFMATPQMSLAL